MNIQEAVKKEFRSLPEGKHAYRIGFVDIHGSDHETELDASDMQELKELWVSLVEELKVKFTMEA